MMRIAAVFCLAAAVAGCATDAPAPKAALAPAVARPLDIPQTAQALERACEDSLARARATIDAMASRREGDILGEWNRMFIDSDAVSNLAGLFAAVHPDKDMRAAGEACEKRFVTLNSELTQNEAIFARLRGFRPANPRQAKLQRDLMRDFEDSGVSLPADKRARAKALAEAIDAERVAFQRNVREDPTKVVFTPAEMEGLPAEYLKARKRDEKGNYVLGLDQPSYGPFMTNAKSGAARERYYRARSRQGGEKNLEHLHKQFLLRQELAALHGLPSFAHYALRRKMAGNPEAVRRFLGEVRAAVQEGEREELEVLRLAKAREIGTDPAATRVMSWDVSYYSEKVRRARYDVDQEKLRAYFPADESVQFALRLAERLYGVSFKESTTPTWHPDVRYFEMRDRQTGRYLANLYMDLFPREGKRPGAFAGAMRTASRLEGETTTAVLVANFERRGFNQRELAVLLHELGHALNAMLSEVDYAPQLFSTVKWDFVEAPSQMFEEWSRREQTLALFAEACPGCPRLSPAEVRRLEEARRFGQASIYSRQWLLATFDMELSTNPRPPLQVWKELESGMPLGHVEGTMFPSSFGHITAGYAAGYYGYMWSQVIARDLLTPFGQDLLDPKVGARYRETIIGAGVQSEEADMVRAFLGRDPRPDAFFAEITGK
jgi:thimet oligopeptidase